MSMNITITEHFQKANSRSANWTYTKMTKAIEVIKETNPDTLVDWEPGDEEWARILTSDGDRLILLICARIPLGFIHTAALNNKALEDIVWLEVSSMSDPSYRIDPATLDQVFGRTVSRKLDYNAVSAEDIWWATV